MAISKVTTSSTNTINKVVVTDGDAISVITVGTQGLAGAATLLGRTTEEETVGSSDAGSTIIYDHANARWLATTSSNATSLSTKLKGLLFTAGGATVTGILDEDNLGSNSNVKLATQQSIKAYVDAQVTAQDFDFQGDSGGALNIDLDSETMTFTGGTGIDTTGSGNTVTFAIDSTVTTLSGSQTLTNKTLTAPVLNTVDINGGDISSGTTINKSPVITLAGDLSGSVTLSNLADGTLTATIAANSVALGTDTTGNYVATLAAANSGIDVANSGSESAAVTVGLNTEFVQDLVGAMFSSNTETNITVTYQDSDGTIDLVIGTLNQDTTGLAGTATALATARTIHGVSFDGTSDIDLTEVVQDTVGAMFSSNTETNITVTYEDGDGTIDLVIGTLNQDTSGNAATATALETSRTIHGVSFDGTANIDLSEVIQDTVGAMFGSNTETNITVTYEDGDGTIDLVVDTSAVTETLTNKTITNPTISDPEFSGTLSTAPSESTTQTVTVTVASKTSEHPYDGGSSSAYVLDGVESPYLTLTPDTTYRFDQADSSNGGHPLRFYYESDKTTAYTTGVTTNGTAGSAGAYTEIKATAATPTVLFYQCSAHALMGNRVNFDTRNLTGFDTDDLTEGSSNLYHTTERVQDIVGAMVSSNTESGIAVTYEDGDGTLDFNVNDPTITIAGDIDGSATMTNLGNVSITTTLDTVNSNVGSFGSATAIPAITVNAKGLVTAVSTNNIATSFTLAADSGSNDTFNTGETLTFTGTSNEITTTVSNNAITFALPDDVTIGNDLIVTGDLTVNGDTVTLNTATLDVEDATIRVAKGATSLANTNGAGIEFGASSSKPTITWDNGNSRLTSNKVFAASSFVGNITGDVTGNSSTATALATARTIHGVSFDGSANIDLSEVISDTVGAMFSSNTETGITVTYQDSDNTIDVVVGTLNQDTTGNSATATALETARTIGGTSFDGTANIAVALSATATALANARTIHGVSFDGTANIDLTEVVQDTVGAMVSSNTETGITVTYQDSDGTIDYVLADSGVSAASYGSATAIPVLAIDAKGRITSASTANISTSFTLSDGSNTQTVAGGDTLTVAGTSNEVDVAVSATDTVTIGLPNDVTVSNNLTVSGNLVVSGTTTQTGSVVTDNNFTGLSNANSGNSVDFGFYGKYVESTTTKYAGIFYDASTDNTFRLFVDTQTVPSTTVNTGATGYAAANLVIAALTTSEITLGSTAITSTAAELNILDGVTATAAEINALDGITAVVGELNALDLGSTAVGTAIASKAVILDSNKDYTGIRNLTISGELDGATLDISGDADIDGTLEADAITVGGVTLAEVISDTVGAMVSSNTESGITVAYDDSDNTLDFTVGTLNQDTTGTAALATTVTITANNSADETIFPVFVDGASGTQGLETDTGFTYNPSTGLLTATGLAGTLATAAQANVTSVGTLTSLAITGDLAVDTNVFKVDTSNNRVGIKQASPSVGLDVGSVTDAILVAKGTTGQRPTGAAGLFRYNTTLSKFEGYTDAWGEIGGGGTSTFAVNTYTANGSTTAFTLSKAPDSEDNVLVFVEGVFMNPNDFVLNGTTLTLDAAPPNGRKIVVYHVSAAVAGTGVHQNSYTGNGSTTAYTLGVSADSENNTQVYIDGVYQNKATYAISGTTLTFDAAPANSAAIEVMTFTQTNINTFPASGISNLTEVTPVSGDHVMIFDATDNALKKADVKDLMETAVGITSAADAVVMTFDSSENATFAANVEVTGDITGQDDLFLDSDAAVVHLGEDGDVTLTHVADTGILLNSSRQLQFGDSGTYIHQSADGVLDLVADTEIEINATTVDVNGALDVSGNITGTLATAAQTNITSLGTLTALTVDDITINGSTISDGGDLTLDVEGDIILDANGGDISFRDAGTEIGRFTNNSTNFQIYSAVQDVDIQFKGNDNGSTVTALTLDMSAAGRAIFNAGGTFNDHVYFGDNNKLVLGGGDDLQIYHDGSNSYIDDAGTGDLIINATALRPRTDLFVLNNAANNKNQIVAQSGAIKLFYDGAEQLETVSGAVYINNKLGIGTTSPTNKAHIYKAASGRAWSVDGGDVLAIENNDSVALDIRCPDANQGLILFSDASARARGIFGYAHASDYMYISTAGSERMRIDSSGRVAIGNTVASSMFGGASSLVAGDGVGDDGITIYSGNASLGRIHFADGTSGSEIYAGFVAYDHNANEMLLGGKGIGSTIMTLGANGSVGAPGGTNIYNASDRRVKQNISTLSDSLAIVKALNPVKFNWIKDFSKSENDKTLYGFIAQEVQTVFPDAVEDFAAGQTIKAGDVTVDDPLAVREKFLIPVLTKAIQEQQTIIEDLKARIETLEG
jgi:hypothetical protein